MHPANRFRLESPTLGATVRQVSADGFRLTESLHAGAVRVPIHAHRFVTMYLTVRGAFVESTGNRELSCAPGTLIFRPAEMRHADRMGGEDVRFFILEVERRDVAGVAADWPGETSVSVGIASARAFSLFRAFRENDPSVVLAAEELCLALLGEARRRPSPDSRSASARRVGDAAEFIRAHFRRPLGAAEIARAAGVHPVHLARLFRKRYGCSLSRFIRRERISDALARLRAGDEPLAEIALSNGFSDQSHFTREFGRETGLSPSRFRRAARDPERELEAAAEIAVGERNRRREEEDDAESGSNAPSGLRRNEKAGGAETASVRGTLSTASAGSLSCIVQRPRTRSASITPGCSAFIASERRKSSTARSRLPRHVS
jgi:AraC family transcriptional regulator